MARRKRGKAPSGGNTLKYFIIIIMLIAAFWYYRRNTREVEHRAENVRKQVDTAWSAANEQIDKLAGIQDTAKSDSNQQQSNSRKKNRKPKQKQYDGEQVTNTAGYDFTKAPGFEYPKAIKGEQILRYTGFTLSYNEKYEQASWVAYNITNNEVGGKIKRADHFREDKSVKTGSASLEDYRGSGYDRGHLAPAGDMKWSEKAMNESFLMSNMSPQAPAFNRGVWQQLEEQVRAWSKENENLYVVTGPVLTDNLKTIGKNKVAVPKYYYKIILDAREPDIKAIGFLVENKGSSKPLESFAVPIDSIEEVTGLDFYPLLPDDMEEKLENKVNLRGWF
jgi:endonuclease G